MNNPNIIAGKEADDEDDGDNDEDDDGDDSDTDTESDNKAICNELNEEIVELTSEISLKQKLIEELEMSQKRMASMKQQYEKKLTELNNRILHTQEERDKVLKNMGGKAALPETTAKIKKDYEGKLDKLQGEVKKLQAAKKEHAKLLKSQGQYEKQLTKLKSDVIDMKRVKVKLVQKMKEESNRHRELEVRKNRELAQLKKETRKHESKIKSLETEKRLKETVLKRKQEEVESLRKTARKKSSIAANKNKKASLKVMKTKWQGIEKTITKVALNKQAVSQMENDMDRWLKEREKLSHRLEKLSQKKRRLLIEKGDSSLVEDMDDQIENIRTNINYLHDNIVECQQNIVQMEQANEIENEDDERDEIAKIVDISDLDFEESKYLLEKLLSMTVNQTCLATQKEGKIKEMDNRMQQALKQNSLHQQLLQHMIEQQDLEIYDLMLQNEDGEEDSDSDSDLDLSNHNPPLSLPASLSSAPLDPMMRSMIQDADDTGTGSDSSLGRREKARRRNLNKEDLLFNDLDVPSFNSDMLMLPPKSLPKPNSATSRIPRTVSGLSATSAASGSVPFSRSLSFTRPPTNPMVRSYSFVKNGATDPASLMTMSMDQSQLSSRLAPVYQPSPVIGRRSLDRQRSMSPRTLRKYNSTARLDGNRDSPPGSPGGYRRSNSREESGGKNVFSRLIAGTTIGERQNSNKGIINPYQGRIVARSPLICTNVAEGHAKAVLSVFATDELLFSASKDRTVKVRIESNLNKHHKCFGFESKFP